MTHSAKKKAMKRVLNNEYNPSLSLSSSSSRESKESNDFKPQHSALSATESPISLLLEYRSSPSIGAPNGSHSPSTTSTAIHSDSSKCRGTHELSMMLDFGSPAVSKSNSVGTTAVNLHGIDREIQSISMSMMEDADRMDVDVDGGTDTEGDSVAVNGLNAEKSRNSKVGSTASNGLNAENTGNTVNGVNAEKLRAHKLVRNSNGVEVQEKKKKKRKRRLSATRDSIPDLIVTEPVDPDEGDDAVNGNKERPQNEQNRESAPNGQSAESRAEAKDKMVSRRRRKRHSLSSNAIKKSMKNPTKKLFESLLHGLCSRSGQYALSVLCALCSLSLSVNQSDSRCFSRAPNRH